MLTLAENAQKGHNLNGTSTHRAIGKDMSAYIYRVLWSRESSLSPLNASLWLTVHAHCPSRRSEHVPLRWSSRAPPAMLFFFFFFFLSLSHGTGETAVCGGAKYYTKGYTRSCRGRLGHRLTPPLLGRLETLLDAVMLVLLVVQVTLEVFAAVSQPLEGEVAAVLLVRVVEQVAERDGIGLAREVESLCEEGFGAGQGALCQNAKCDFGVSRPRIGRVDEEHRKRCLFGNHGRGPDKEWWEATYQSEAVLVPCDEGAAEGFDRCDGGLGSLGDGDVDVRSAEVFDALYGST